MVSVGNLLTAIPDASGGELFETLSSIDGLRIERIVSKGQATAAGDWYDQAWHEWVLLVEGEALLVIEGEQEPYRLLPGQWMLLPAHCRHRVEWTLPGQNTVWLALHWPEHAGCEEGAT
jgi:cupin 2 domain-containing protein